MAPSRTSAPRRGGRRDPVRHAPPRVVSPPPDLLAVPFSDQDHAIYPPPPQHVPQQQHFPHPPQQIPPPPHQFPPHAQQQQLAPPPQLAQPQQFAPPLPPAPAPPPPAIASSAGEDLFLDPILGNPLAFFVDKDVDYRDLIVDLITRHGGLVSNGYSNVPYILVNPHRESGQSLFRLYLGKKGKTILNARWVIACVEAGALQTYQNNFAGCKVTGNEELFPVAPPAPLPPQQQPPSPPTQVGPLNEMAQHTQQGDIDMTQHPQQMPQMPPPELHQHPPPYPFPYLTEQHFQLSFHPEPQQLDVAAQSQLRPSTSGPIASRTRSHNPPSTEQSQQVPQPQPQQPAPAPSPLGALPHPAPIVAGSHSFPFPVFAADVPSAIEPPTAAPPQTWEAPNGIAPSQTHLHPPPQQQQQQQQQPLSEHEHEQAHEQHAQHMDVDQDGAYAQEHQPWDGGYDMHAPQSDMGPPGPYDFRYRDVPPGWVPDPNAQYFPQYDPSYVPQEEYMPEAGPSHVEAPPPPPPPPPPAPERPRGRKRTRMPQHHAPPPETLVANRRNPPGRSPTPPKRIVKSTYGGNLFTDQDIEYLGKYIEYCQAQGLVLSLREICERIAIRAPHHTFFSWRRFCNKHKIKLGGYAMDLGDDGGEPDVAIDLDQVAPLRAGPDAIATAQRLAAADQGRSRSPTPPRALYRSTTGKGVAFTQEDVNFLVRFLNHRTQQTTGKVDMVIFWKDVAAKAPHHSRASWMKFYRRHKHELHHQPGADEPLPAPPDKKLRYSRADDVLLAKFFFDRPEGTSDNIFQQFGRMHPHHPWKGWQEHHRIHKATIDHLIQLLSQGKDIDETAEQQEA